MQINISGHHVDLTDSLRDYVNSKFAKLERHSDQINSIHVVLNVEKLTQLAEATIHINGGEIFASAENGDMYTALDELIDKLDRQVLKLKGKKSKH